MIRIWIVFRLVVSCLWLGVNPMAYFQLNAHFFNVKKGLFSKFDLESFVPEKWRLKSILIQSGNKVQPQAHQLRNFKYPLFLKPEWGQNSYGVSIIHHKKELDTALRHIVRSPVDYLCQEASLFLHEYEIFFIRNSQQTNEASVFRVVRVISRDQTVPTINGIYSGSQYVDITKEFSSREIQTLKQYMLDFNCFAHARISVKANSEVDLLSGQFHVIEINIFIPMSLSLLDQSMTISQKIKHIAHQSRSLALLIKHQKSSKKPAVFWRSTLVHFKMRRKDLFISSFF